MKPATLALSLELLSILTDSSFLPDSHSSFCL